MTGAGTRARLGSLVSELRRRRVFRVAIVYAAVAWAIIEVSSTVLPALNVPTWSVPLVIVLVVAGFPIAMIMSWIFDVGTGGIERTAPAMASPMAVASPATIPPDGTRRDDVSTGVGPAAPSFAPRLADASGNPRERRSIAVLPFINMSGEPDNEYFSDGISEEILNLLVRLPQLQVASRTSSFFFKGKQTDIPTVAARLHVDTVLEGSVRRAGSRVRIAVQLIDVASDSNLWSETYDRELSDVFAIQDDIAQSIVDALKVTLSPKERRAIQYVATADVGAYDDYLRGRKFYDAWNRRDNLRAIGMYERAIEKDPKYAAAWAGLADAYVMRHRFLEHDPAHVDHALHASERAVQLDADSAEAHASRGLALYLSKQFDQAEHEFETAMMLNPNLFEAYFLYGTVCSSRGNFEKAAWLYRRASDVSPTDYLPLVYLSQAFSEMGRTDDERRARLLAIGLIERALETNPHDARARYMGAANLATLGQRDKAIEWANRALQASDDEPMIYYNAACTFSELGETARAIELLERAVELGWGDRAWMENDSDLAALRKLPGFQAILRRLG